MTELKPSINTIQHNLFAPSYYLIKAWVEQPETLDSEIIKKLEASDLAQQEKQAYLHSKEPEESDRADTIAKELFADNAAIEEPPVDLNIPTAIKNLIQQRSVTSSHQFSNSPSEGLIFLLNQGNGSSDDLDLAMASPLVIILDQVTKKKNVWTAWMVATETDYATHWDLLLDLNKDAPLDPLAGMIQTWNPLEIYLPLLKKVIGELKPKRITALRKLANEYKKTLAISGATTNRSKAIQQYQEMYTDVATFIEKKIQIIESPFENWKTAFLLSAEKLGQLFIPTPVVNHAMGTETTDNQEKNWLLDEHYLFNFNEQTIDGKLLIEISIKHTHPSNNHFTIEYKENGFLSHHATLSKQTSKTEFICDPDNCDTQNPTELIIKDSDGKELHRLNLDPNYPKKTA